MKTIVIPDVHHLTSVVDEIFKREDSYDQAIFLGDTFDAIDDSPQEAQKVAEWLKQSLCNPKHTHLLGNHDIGYAYNNNNPHTKCSGYSNSKKQLINEVLKTEDWDKLKFFYIHHDFLFSHAGLHPDYFHPTWKANDVTLDNLQNYLAKEAIQAIHELRSLSGAHWFFNIGDARRYRPIGMTGGLVWCDFDNEFKCTPGLAQVFGHTYQRHFPCAVKGDTGLVAVNSESVLKQTFAAKDEWNINLDCHLRYYAVIENEQLQIKTSK